MKAFPAIYQQPHRVDAAMKAQQQGPSYLNRHRGHVSSADGRINDSHPILGNYHLPVDIENVPKPSGLQNLLREGWDEDQCRNFLVRVLGWVPRNFQYEDGLRIIHPKLQERFGDENVDLACAVLEELVNGESPPPFPEAVYQRWKHRHRNRREDLLLPHSPHTTTILAQVVPTKAPLTSRDTSETVRVATTTLSLPSQTASDSTSTAPTSPAFITGRSASAHLGTAWQIEHSIFVSKGGGDASVLYCPTPEDFHRHLWDPNFGRGGKLVEERRLLMGKHGLKGYRGGEDKVPMSAENIQAKIKIKTRSKFRARCSLRRCRERKTKSASTPSVPGSYNARPDDFVPLPENTRIPHGVFARKHGIIPEGDTMPVFILRGERQPTIDEISLKKCEEVFPRAITLAKKLGDLRSLDENDAAELQEKSVDAYLSQIPSTPGLFFDSGIEYKWDTETTSPQLFPLQFSAPSCIMKENLTHDYPKDLPHFPTASVPNLTAPGLSVTTRSQDPDQNQGMTLDVTHTLSLESHNRDLNGPPVAGWHALPVSTQETVLSKHCSSARPVDCEYEGAPERELKQRHLNAVRSIGGRNDKHPTLCGHLQARKSGNSPRLVPRIERNPLRQRSVEQENEPGDGPVLVRKARTLNRDRGQARSFDGTRDDFHFSYDNNSNKQTYSHNTHNTNKLHNKTHNEKFLSALMDPDQLFTQPPAVSPTKPLHVRKQSSKTHLERSQQQLSDNNPYKNYSKTPIYPPRTSSIQKFVPCNASEIFQARETINDSSPTLNSARSTFSSYRGTYLSDTSAEVPSTARTTLERHEAHGISNLTSGIMGDFIPIDQDATNHSRATESGKPSFDVSPFNHQAVQAKNPYEFEPDSPYNNDDRQTTFTDFIKSYEVASSPSPRSSHLKNSRSEGNALYLSQGTSPSVISPSRPSGSTIHRSDSSPSVLPLRFPTRRERPPSPDIISYYQEDEEPMSPARRGRENAEDTAHRGRHLVQGNVSRSPPRQQLPHQVRESDSRSPTRFPGQVHSKDCFSMSLANGRYLTQSPTKTLDDVVERDEFDTPNPSLASPTISPKKRSRSPMKKMFGDHGWLGQSPNEVQEHKLISKNSSMVRKEEATRRQKKPSMIGKLKNKLEEIAEKADLSPGIFRSDQEKHPKLSVLSVSLGPPEQARIYMEIELMLVHTANSFLMNQFSQGRIAVDSIKKTVDMWKSKGRPLVIEFMYDQATQRDLVAANQHNFRFHGERAGDNIRINSMLYNWKQVANLMAIRTFCNADTVTLKLLFDIEQILELLGAGEPMMLRLQQIRASANEMMRIARRDKDRMAAAPPISNGREMAYNSNASAGSTSRSQSMDDPYYDGLKVAPNFCVE